VTFLRALADGANLPIILLLKVPLLLLPGATRRKASVR
jgi:hypothetical protein